MFLRRVRSILEGIQWDQSRLFDASSAHIGWAGFATLGFCLLAHIPFWMILLGFCLFAFVKEYLFDLTVERGETFWTSTLDATTYLTGVFLADLALYHVGLAFFTSVILLIGMAIADYFGFFRFVENFGK